MPINPATWEAEMKDQDLRPVSLGKKLETLSQHNKPGTVMHACESQLDRRFRLGIEGMRPYLKNKAKQQGLGCGLASIRPRVQTQVASKNKKGSKILFWSLTSLISTSE
jgi:hypothetical protein